MGSVRKPEHIVFMLSDQHNPDVAGFAGDRVVRTPNLDRLSEAGITFENCYCSSPLCVPSRMSMLSSRLPSETGVVNNFQALPSHLSTFAHSLSIAGYETVLCGRMHFNGPDQSHGFEKRLVGDLTPSYPGMTKDVYGALIGTDYPAMTSIEKAGPGDSAVLQYDRDVTKAALEYMSSRTDPRPLFMLVGYYGPHCPYVAPPDLYHYYEARLPDAEEVTDSFRNTVHPAVQQWYRNRGVEHVSSRETSRVRAAYYGMVEFLDSLIGEVIEGAGRELGIDNTMLMYASDHGDTLGENGLFWKTNFYEGSARVPLIFSWPHTIAKGARVSHPVSLMDIGPTLIDIGEGPRLPRSDGPSLKGVLSGREQGDPNRAVFSQLADVKGDNPSAMIRKENWKLVIHAGYEHPQLFDLESDPKEKRDLGEDDDYRGVRESLVKEIQQVWDEPRMTELHRTAMDYGLLYKKWVQVVGREGVTGGDWYGDVSKNYVRTNV